MHNLQLCRVEYVKFGSFCVRSCMPRIHCFLPRFTTFFLPALQSTHIQETTFPNPITATMGVKKSTRKFEKNRLPKVLKKRKVANKAKQLHALNEKRKKKRRLERGEDTNEEEGESQGKSQPKASGDELGIAAFEGMSVDDFLAGGFEVPEMGGMKKKHRRTKGKEGEGNRTGKKRKRTPEQIMEGEEGEEGEEEWRGIDDASGSGGDDVEAEFKEYKAQVGELAEKDPEFYKYLQENDAELLEFKDQLSEIDDLSESDDSDSAEEGTKSKTKQKMAAKDEEKKPFAEEVTKEHVERWKKLLTEEKSLRTLRKVVLAFRAAVHVSDEDSSHRFKYTITNADSGSPTHLPYSPLHFSGLTVLYSSLQRPHAPRPATDSHRYRSPPSSERVYLRSHSYPHR